MDAERSILGAMLIDARAVELACDLTPAHFTNRQNAELFEIMKALHDGGTTIDIVTITDVMPDIKVTWLTQMMNETPSIVGVEDYIRIVKERHQRRSFILGMERAVKAATNGNEYIADAESVLNETINLGSADVRPVGEYVEEAYQSLGRKDKSGLKTGFLWLDNTLHGLKPGQLIVVAGCTRMGKTSFAMNVALDVAQHQRVAVFSLEMTRKELLQRAIISVANVNEDEMNQHPDAQDALNLAALAVKSLDLYVDDKAGVTVDYIKAQCHRIKPALIVIDYLGLVRTRQRKNGTREQEISEVTRSIKVMAKELNAPVLLLAQLNRGVDVRKDKQPVLSDLRESGSIEQDADIVLFLHRPIEYDDKADPRAAIIDIAKHRNGQSGEIEVQWDGAHFKYSDKEATSGKTPWH